MQPGTGSLLHKFRERFDLPFGELLVIYQGPLRYEKADRLPLRKGLKAAVRYLGYVREEDHCRLTGTSESVFIHILDMERFFVRPLPQRTGQGIPQFRKQGN